MKKITICASLLALLIVPSLLIGCSSDSGPDNAEAVQKNQSQLPASDPNYKPPVRDDGKGGMPGKGP